MNALAVQNPRHKCDWEAGTIITDKKIVADNTDLTIIIIIILYVDVCACVLYRTYTPYQSYIIPSRSSALIKIT